MSAASDCVGKEAFTSFALAERIAKRRGRRQAYLCAHCRSFHIGSVMSQKPKFPWLDAKMRELGLIE